MYASGEERRLSLKMVNRVCLCSSKSQAAVSEAEVYLTNRTLESVDSVRNGSVRATTSCAGRQGDGRVNPSSISPMWGMQTVAVPMVTADLCCHSFKTFVDKC